MGDVPQLKINLNKEQTFLVNKMVGQINDGSCRAVSFRLMNTLVCTPFSEIYDLFLLMEDDFRKVCRSRKKFHELRIYAESRFPKDLEKIYDFIMKQAKISESESRTLMKRECEIISEFAFPRSFGKRLFEEAKRRRKKIIIVADTVYPRSVILNIIERCGYGEYSELIVSGELPEEADIYDTVIERAKVPCQKILNIGGSISEDVEKPIMKGSKALLMTDAVPLMIKSGRLRGYIQARHLYDYDSPDFLAFHLALGLYSAYMFDVPCGKVFQSDFCANPYMFGFLVMGMLSLDEDFRPDDLQKKIISAIGQNEEAERGRDDFRKLFSSHFGKIPGKLKYKGFSEPFEFFVKHGAAADREFLSGLIDEETSAKWAAGIKEPKVVKVSAEETRQNRLTALADKMFPPGTKVRMITDSVLSKMKGKIKI